MSSIFLPEIFLGNANLICVLWRQIPGVEFTKSSLTTGKELPGCKLKVVDADGNIVDEWTSGKEAHVIRELTVGKEYTHAHSRGSGRHFSF